MQIQLRCDQLHFIAFLYLIFVCYEIYKVFPRGTLAKNFKERSGYTPLRPEINNRKCCKYYGTPSQHNTDRLDAYPKPNNRTKHQITKQ